MKRYLPILYAILLGALFFATAVYFVKTYQSAVIPPVLPIPSPMPPLVKENLGSFSITALPVNFEANAINDKGEIAGTWDTHEKTTIYNATSNAALWRQGEVRLFLRLDNTPQCKGFCLSDNGWVGGSAGHIYIDPSENPSLAVLWDASGKKSAAQSLGQLPNLSRTVVLSLNTRGQAVGTSSSSNDGEMRDGTGTGVPFLDVSHAFFWDGRKMQDLGDGEACGINEGGQVVGTQNKKIVLWQNGTKYILGNGKAHAINNRGQIAGDSYFGRIVNNQDVEDEALPLPPHAVLWDKGVLKDLGALMDGGASTAAALNDRGQIVGNSTYANKTHPGYAHTFLWQAGKMYDLNALIPTDSGWILCEARGINNKGQITGVGTLNGNERSFLLTPLR